MAKLRVTRSIIPNLFTLMNLFGGFIAITRIAQDDFYGAMWFMILASIFDALDGAVARLTNSTSELGVELDSLCDAVSFGLAPAFLLYKAHFFGMGSLGLILAALPALAGTYRLARFNVLVSGFQDKRYFVGMPIPSGAITIFSYVIFFHAADFYPAEWRTPSIIIVSIGTAMLMVSKIKFDNLPRLSHRALRERPAVVIGFVLGFVAVIVSQGQWLFPLMLVYISFGLLRALVQRLRRTDVDDDLDDMEEGSGPGPFDM